MMVQFVNLIYNILNNINNLIKCKVSKIIKKELNN